MQLLLQLPLLLLLTGSSAFLPSLAAVKRQVQIVPLLMNNDQNDRLSLKKPRKTISRHGRDGPAATTTRLGLLPDTLSAATAAATLTTTIIETVPQQAMVATDSGPAAQVVSGLHPATTVLIFLVGLIPFAVATVEFWRRIRFGESFGTGNDSVVFTDVSIGEDNAPLSSRGNRVLGSGALITAIILFAVAAAVIALAVVSVVTSEIPTSF
jgi:hypothetical protein